MSPHEIELIYELSPMQQAMLFHTLLAPRSGVYIIQMALRLTGRLDLSAFLRAWQHLVERHGILRTAFFWEGLEKPLQVVYRQAELPLRRESWRGLDAGEQAVRLSRFLASERDRGFDLAEAPLMRLALFELEPGVHQMVWTLHHVLVDGWSQGQLLRELFTSYAAFTQGGEPRLAPAGSFRDYIAWLQRQDPGKAEAFWRKSLAGLTEPTLLAGGEGRSGGPGQTVWREARRRDLRLPAETAAALREASRRHRLTLNTLVQGAWSLLLAQASGRDDVVFGTTVAGRPAELPGVESTLGLFINTQPVRVPVRPDERLWPWLAALQERQVEMRRYEHAPLVDVQRWSGLPAGVPLFDHLLIFENVALPAELARPVAGLEIAEEAAHDLTNYPLSVVAIPGQELLLTIRYDAGRFEAPDVARMLERLARLLETFAEDRDLALCDLPLLLPAERHQALVEWNDTARSYPTGICLHELVAAQAGRTPQAVAASFEGVELAYVELESRASQLARHLIRLGVRPDDRVGVRMERSLEMIVALLGTMKAGAAYVPLDPSWPEARLARLVESSGARVVLPSEGGALTPGPFPASGRGVNAPILDQENLAYVLFTSGSTGTPKGVMIPHRGIVNRLLWMQEAYGLTPADRVLQKTPFSFDVSLWEFFWPLLVGARLVFAKPEGHKDPAYLVDLIAREKITILHFVPSMLQAFLEAPRLESLTSLRKVMASGEALPLDLVRRFFARLPGVELHNLYGPTEASVDVSFWACVPEPPRSVVPIGRPIGNLRLHVVDRDLRPLPIGVPGELLLGGVGLARGYLGRPELTAAAFVPDPLGGEPGGRLYRTGDLTRFLPDGHVEYLGRIDHQVKIRGFRIELGEVESTLTQHPEVRAAAVVARRDDGETRLVAYVALDRTDPTDPSDPKALLSAWLREKLPDYMVPTAFVVLEAFPLTTSGKVDRKALPAPERPVADAASYIAPADPVEELLAGTWAEVLGVDRVGVHDDFFALGGHSLLATQVASRIREALGIEIPLRHLFEAPTVAGLAERIDAQAMALADRETLAVLLGALERLSEEEARARLDDPRALRAMVQAVAPSLAERPEPRVARAPAALPRRDGVQEFPLSFAQQRLWFLDQLEPDSPAYNIPLPVRLQGELPAALLERTAAEIVRRHETLRTTFAAHEGGPVQVVHENLLPLLPIVDLSALPDAEREERARRIAQEEAWRPFDLRTGPLLRLTVVRLAEGDHLLLVTLHHIVSDGWSMGVLLREVAALFEAFAHGRPSPLAELPFQYADFAVWQRRWLEGAVLEEQLAFWKGRLAGAPQVLELPTDRPRPAVQTGRGATVSRPFAPDLAAAVRELCRQEDATLFMALLAAWAVELGRTAGQEDLLVGSPVAGRHARGTEHLIGFFVNTLVLRIQWSPDASFRSLLGQVRQVALDAFSHQDVPFERLVEELVPVRDLSRAPLFQTMFELQEAPRESWRMPGLTMLPVPLKGETSKFDLSLTFSATPQGLVGGIEHSTDLFDRTTGERLLQRFAVMVEGAAGDPDRPLAELPWLLDGERQQVLVELNDTRSGPPPEASIPDAFAARVAAAPDAPAVVEASGEVWSYRRLDEASGRLARHLAALGVEPGGRVGVAMERSAGLLVALLAILKAGAAYVPLDPAYPDERLAFLLEDAEVGVVLVQEGTRERMAALAPSLLSLELLPSLPSPGSEPALPEIEGDALAYVIYTSGSTGRPKGVAVPHRAVLRLVFATEALRLGPDDRLAFNANTSFDAATWEIWGALLAGAALVVVPQDLLLAPVELAGLLRRERATVLHLTTSLFNRVAREAPEVLCAPSLRCALFGGEAADPEAVARALENAQPARLLHMYGPTESTTFATCLDLSSSGLAPGATTVPIGRPLGATTAYVLDRSGEPAAAGQLGELFLGGDGLAWGYLQRPDLTAERFLPDPWGSGPGERLYRTGDLVRLRSDGALEFQGRIDRQVKIRGFRIEPGEVEALLAGRPGVAACAVLARRDGQDGDARLVAYVVPAADAALTAESLREDLKTVLPEHLLPSVLVFLDALPLTPNGKVDRRALPAPEVSDLRGAAAAYAAPSSPLEAKLAAVWGEVLGLDRVGVDDNFFALGGHSLLATRVVSRMRTLGLELPLRLFFEGPTIRQLARRLVLARPAEGEPPLVAARVEGNAPLSFAQQRLWFLDQLEPDSPAYNIPLAVRLTGDLSVELLERTFAEVVRRHEALRTTFAVEDGRPVQVIAPAEAARPELRVFDLSDAPEEAREEWARQVALGEARSPFDLQRGPLLRLGLLRLDEREHLLLVTLHHIVSDGWSMGVLLREIGSLYTAFLRGEPSPLPELPLQYADFSRWQRSWLQGEVLEAQLAYWRAQLAGAPALLELPTDRPRPAVQTYRGAAVERSLPPTLSLAIQDLCRREGATPFMLLLAAWGVVLGRHAGQEDVLVGTPIAGRHRREIEDLIGLFVNTLVLRIRPAAPTFRELLGRVRQTALDAYAHQDLPFEQVVEALAPERDLSHAPLFQVLFAVQNAPREELRLPGLTLAPMAVEGGVAKFDLTLAIVEGPGGFAAGLEHNTDLFDRSTAARWLARFEVLLAAAVDGPDRGLADLPLLLPAERQQVLVEWNNDASEILSGPCLHELFAAQAARTPRAVALVAGDVRLTYAELAARAGRLARRLRALGAGPEVRVAVCLERSADLIAALLGVLASGGAYVPIDPTYPAERRALMLEDSGAALLVTRGDLAAGIPFSGVRVEVDHPTDLTDRTDPSDLPPITPGHLAYVIYTSGSTGRPKGVAIEHRSAVALAGWARATFSAGELSGVLAATSVCFDLSVFEIFAPLAWGGTVILAENALELPALAAASEVRLVNTVPSAAAELVRSGGLPPSVRTVCLAGEPLPAILAAALYATGTVERVLDLYGPSEDTTYSTGAPVPRSSERAPAIGRPLPGTRAYVVDPTGRPAPLGVAGELWLAGAGLARGYLGRPELTAERFTPDPFGSPSGEGGGRVYRTGDLARFRPDGELDFLGRIDSQVKVRGFRIELGEIETVLRSHPAVREAVVMVRDESGDRRLVAWVVPDPGRALDMPPSALVTWLREKLPDYMVPAAFVALGALPLTPTGKVDRKALPDPERRVDAAPYLAPREPLEELLAGVWREVLQLDRIGVHDSFFALGGHSMLAAQVANRLRETLGVPVPLRRIFEAPTIAQLARTLGGGIPEESEPVPPAAPPREPVEPTEPIQEMAPRRTEGREISLRLAALSPDKRQLLDAVLRERRAGPAAGVIAPREDRQAPLPLSFSQERMWFLHLLDPRSEILNVFLGVRLDGALRPGLLAAGFAELTRRHQILVTRYELAGARPVQVIEPGGPFRLPHVDLSALPEELRAAELDRLQVQESSQPFDLIHGPVLRASLVRLSGLAHVLLLTVHHIAIDGWSLRVLLNELAALYAAFAAGEPSPLPAPPLQYADYAVWQREQLQGEALERQRAYWLRQLEPPLPVLALPTDGPRQVPQPFRFATADVAFSAALTADLHALGAGRGASLFMVLLAGLASVLHRSGGDERILVGAPIAGRNRRETEDLVGCFLNTLLLRVDLDGDPGFGALLERTAGMALEAFSHQDLPLEMLLQELRIESGAGSARGPFQVMLLVQNLRRLQIEVPGLTLTGLTGERQVELGAAVFELGLTVEEHGGALQARMEYNALLWSAATLQRLLGHLRELLRAAVADPGTRLSDLPLLSAAEREEALAWNPPVPSLSAASRDPVPVLFAAQAARTPEAEALRHGDRRMTYGELDRRSHAIAGRLRALGVGPEVPVAVFLERSPELIAAFLGVLRAGGVYAPLDPALPAERLAWILEDLAPAVLVTDDTLAARLAWTGRRLCAGSAGEAACRATLASPVPEQGAYVIYTSGSTGRPKGVVVPHGALSSFVAAAQDLYGIESRDRVLQLASLGFDTSVEEIYPCLTAGGTLVLRTDEMAGTIAGFLQGCEEHGITVLDLPTAFWHELVTSPELAARGLPAAVRAVILGGERPLPERVAAWLRQSRSEGPRARLFNTYGPTEATVVATAAELPPEVAAEGWREVSMGQPLPGVQAHVLDRSLQPVPVDVPGELVLGGITLARGYLRRPDLTAERFVPDPFSGTAGARLYRTGDLGRRRADGSLEFAGRVDHQVKIRGFRVEPGEIESALAACPEVAECAVVAREEASRPGDLRLVAYVTPTPGAKASAADLRAFLESRLPAWMVPAAFVALAALPRTPTGKIDRRALPAPDGLRLDAERSDVAPRNEVEEIIAEIWCEALGLERLSVFDGFFELGGHSLLLLQVMQRLRDAFDLDIPLRSIYEERTVAALAIKVEELALHEIQQPA